MYHNKILGTAIAAALCMTAHNAIADLSIAGGAAPTEFAYEDFGTSGDKGDITPTFQTAFKVDANISTPFTMTYSLDGAVWKDALSGASIGAYTNETCLTASTHPPTINLSGGLADETEAVFNIQASGSNFVGVNEFLCLSFGLDKAYNLATLGGQVKMTATPSNQDAGGASTKAVITSAKGINVTISPDAANARTVVDVSQGSKKFDRNSADGMTPLIVDLGTIKIEETGKLDRTGVAYTLATGDTNTLTITNGIFSASLGQTTATPIVYDKVCLDVQDDDTCNNSATLDFAPKTLDDDTAVFEDLTQANLQAIITNPVNEYAEVIVIADGSTTINVSDQAPSVVLSVSYTDGPSASYTGTLKHVKSNGKTCTIYNVPNGNVDVPAIKITNTSGGTGKLMGTLKGQDGVVLFDNVDLAASIAPYETKTFSTDCTGGWCDSLLTIGNLTDTPPWKGRAVLTIRSDLSSMVVYGLVRNKNGGPQTNMSTGAANSGCD